MACVEVLFFFIVLLILCLESTFSILKKKEFGDSIPTPQTLRVPTVSLQSEYV